MRIIFAGTPEISKTILQYLLDCQLNIIGCYTQPDRAKGRGQHLEASPVKTLGQHYNLPVFQPENFKAPETVEHLRALQPDVIVVVAYGLILPYKVLEIAPLGCINIHASLLPRWRGASPITQAILAGDNETGITIMRMDKGMDTGPILSLKSIKLAGSETTKTLTESLATLGKIEIVKILEQLAAGKKLTPQPQDHTFATYAPKINKPDALINWSLSADVLERQIRAYNPWPVAFTFLHGENVKIWQANVVQQDQDTPVGKILDITKHGIFVSTGQGTLQITSMQFPSKKIMTSQDLFNYKKIQRGDQFETISF